ncbi:hypothetical protein NIES21_27320 [Anabaenopsis circularis NIES-21]|uniref:Uncharacterized protein n=1 Tax=Anabaenopsis circularis NIES-21 TaxID=1085406 RepID=A0A1Z4GHN4_9CYAN|nr:hypothetical protein NIES21_27320 [Anabaenopsis circularis NIES-21]
MQLQIAKKKAALIETQSALEKQMREVSQKQSSLDRLMQQTRQIELSLQQQINKEQPKRETQIHSVTYKPANKKLQQELLTLLHGNTEIATRLLQQQQNLNPGYSADWYLEKVIHDLKRDRQ